MIRDPSRYLPVVYALEKWDAAAARIKLWHVDVQIGAQMDEDDIPIACELGRVLSGAAPRRALPQEELEL